MTKWNIKQTRVYSNGEGRSYNCTNIITAKDLHNTLTEYENKIHHIEKQINTTKNAKQIVDLLNETEQELKNQKDLNTVYTDFIKDKGYTIEDISKWSWKKYE